MPGWLVKKVSLTRAALLFALAAAGSLHAQLSQPTVNVQPAPGGSNLVFQLNTQSNWFYTFQQSTDLSTWLYATDYFAGGSSLGWTNPIGSNDSERFFRVSVNPPNTTIISNYHSWTNVVSLNNGLVEALVSPTDGRIQQFRFLGNTNGGFTNGVFWENASLYGHTPTGSGSYADFGGDKAWPSPQSSWSASQVPWPPPTGFDGFPNTISNTNGIVTMVTPVDSTFKIQTTKIIELLFNEPVLRVRTIFNRTATSTKTNILGVWLDCEATVTNTTRCYVPIPSPSIFSNGFTTNGSTEYTASLPAAFTNTNGIVSFGPDGTTHKIGFDSSTLVLVGTNFDLRVDAPRVAGATYPDGGASTEVYTAATTDFELEALGPMSNLPVGGQIEFDVYYSIFQRTETNSDAEAQKVLAWHY